MVVFGFWLEGASFNFFKRNAARLKAAQEKRSPLFLFFIIFFIFYLPMLHANLLHEVKEIEHRRSEFHIVLVIVRRKSGGHLLKFQQERRLCLVHFVPRDLTKARVSFRQQDGILAQMVHQSGELDDAAVVTRRMCRCDYDLACVGDRSNQRGAFF